MAKETSDLAPIAFKNEQEIIDSLSIQYDIQKTLGGIIECHTFIADKEVVVTRMHETVL